MATDKVKELMDSKYPTAYVNMLKMIRSRGYDVPDALFDAEPVSSEETMNLTFTFKHEDTGRVIVMVYFDDNYNSGHSKEVPQPTWVEVLKNIDDNGTIDDAVFLVYKNLRASDGINALLCRSNFILGLTVFSLSEMLYYLPDHVLVPKYTIVEPEEYVELFATDDLDVLYKILPRMLSTDPVAKFMGLEQYEIVRVEQKVPVHRILYRMVE